MERVSIVNGKLPLILVAPHGYYHDDKNTDTLTRWIATNINAYAVINNAWERADYVDCMTDKADCNKITHCHEDVVREEFLDPILRFKIRILKQYNKAYILYIHGMGNHHRKIANDPRMDAVIGYGAGSPDRLTCAKHEKDHMYHYLQNAGMNVYFGKKGGAMSGWSANNMNQLFRTHYLDGDVQSMQIEIMQAHRENVKDLVAMTDKLSFAFENFLNQKSIMSVGDPKYY